MIQFRRLRPEDKADFHGFLQSCDFRGCEYSFVNLFCWGRQEVAHVGGRLAFFSHFGGRSLYTFPIGEGALGPVLEALAADARERGIPFRMTSLLKEDCEALEALYPGEFRIYPDRDSADYVYEIHRLADLKGKKLQGKRNHINRFVEAYPNWHTQVLDDSHLPACRELIEAWYREHAISDPTEDYSLEKVALDRALRYREALGLEGLLLYAGERLVAMTMGSRLNCNTFDVHFEKAYADIPGAYPMINREFARYIREKYPEIQYLDREDDMGLPGLRKAKESYVPDLLLEQYWAVMVEDVDSD